MNISIKLVYLVLLIFVSCGDATNNKNETSKKESVQLSSIKITGDFRETLTCERAVMKYEEYMGEEKPYLMVELTRNSKNLPIELSKDFKNCGYGTGDQDICFQLSIEDELGVPFASSNRTYSGSEILQVLKLKNGESGWLKFTWYKDDVKQINEKYNSLNSFNAKIATSYILLEESLLKSQKKIDVDEDKVSINEITDILTSYAKLIETISDDNIVDVFGSSDESIRNLSYENVDDVLKIYKQMIDTQLDMYKELNKGDETSIILYKKTIDQYIDMAKKISEFDSSIDTIELNKINEISDQYMKILSKLSE